MLDVVCSTPFRLPRRLTPEHVVVVTQQRGKGYVYSPEQHGFVQDPDSTVQDAGSGYSMLQVCACCGRRLVRVH